MKLKVRLLAVFLFLQLALPWALPALERLSENQLKQVHAQAGISIAATNAVVYVQASKLAFTAVDNMDPFGIETPDAGYFSLDDFLGLLTLNGVTHMDAGIYSAPDESLFVTDIAKSDGTAVLPFEHLYQGVSPDSGLVELQSDPLYWAIGDDVERPLDGSYGVVQIQMDELTAWFDFSSSLSFCDKALGSMGVSGLRMPELVQDSVNIPGSVVTLFPGPGSSINLELRLRLSVDEFHLSGAASSSLPDFVVSGVHLGEAFGFELPDHLEGTGDASTGGIDTSTWAVDITPVMYSGYFLLGNLNQVDFTDNINQSPAGFP